MRPLGDGAAALRLALRRRRARRAALAPERRVVQDAVARASRQSAGSRPGTALGFAPTSSITTSPFSSRRRNSPTPSARRVHRRVHPTRSRRPRFFEPRATCRPRGTRRPPRRSPPARRQPLAAVLAATRCARRGILRRSGGAPGGASAVRRRRRRLLARRARAARVVRVGPLAALRVDRKNAPTRLLSGQLPVSAPVASCTLRPGGGPDRPPRWTDPFEDEVARPCGLPGRRRPPTSPRRSRGRQA